MNRIEVFIKFDDIKEAQLQASTLERQLGGIYEVVFLIPSKIFTDCMGNFVPNVKFCYPKTLLGRRFRVVEDNFFKGDSR